MEHINGEMITERARIIISESKEIISKTSAKTEIEKQNALLIMAFRKIAELQLELEHITGDPGMHTMIRQTDVLVSDFELSQLKD